MQLVMKRTLSESWELHMGRVPCGSCMNKSNDMAEIWNRRADEDEETMKLNNPARQMLYALRPKGIRAGVQLASKTTSYKVAQKSG